MIKGYPPYPLPKTFINKGRFSGAVCARPKLARRARNGERNKVLVELFQKLAGVGRSLTVRPFFFLSFFLWPIHAKKKAGDGERRRKARRSRGKTFLRKGFSPYPLPKIFMPYRFSGVVRTRPKLARRARCGEREGVLGRETFLSSVILSGGAYALKSNPAGAARRRRVGILSLM